MISALLAAAATALPATAPAGTPALPPPPPPPEVVARDALEVRVLQGDLLWISGQRVRLAGVVSVDRSQRCAARGGFLNCGLKAVDTLTAAIGAQPVRCVIQGEERSPYVRDPQVLLGRCAAGGEDLSLRMVSEGYALPKGAGFQQIAMDACVARKGLWSSYVESPLTFRQRRKGEPVRPLFIGAGSGTSCLEALGSS